MFKTFALAGLAAAAFAAAPASAATTVTFGPGTTNPGGNVTLFPAGPGAVSRAIDFDVSGVGDFTVTFFFTNPFSPVAKANASASFNYDPDIITFTGGNFSGGGVAIPGITASGVSIQIDRFSLLQGPQTLTLTGRINSPIAPTGGNDFARIGGSLTLTAVPEPTTWALFILGFGMVGHTMRRRSSKVRVSRAALTFA